MNDQFVFCFLSAAAGLVLVFLPSLARIAVYGLKKAVNFGKKSLAKNETKG